MLQAAGHVAAFEASLVHLLQRCGVPYRAPIQEPPSVDKEKAYQSAGGSLILQYLKLDILVPGD